MSDMLNDQELVMRYRDGDVASFQILVDRYQNKIYSYVLMLVKDKQLADDIFQDTFLKIIRTIKAGAYKEEGKFIQFAMRIAHNLIIDYFRKSKRLPMVDPTKEDYDMLDNARFMDPSIEEQIVTEQIHDDIRKMVDYLPEEQREVLVMRMYDDMSFKEIADATNVSINTALGRMRYALINLRKMAKQKNVALIVA